MWVQHWSVTIRYIIKCPTGFNVLFVPSPTKATVHVLENASTHALSLTKINIKRGGVSTLSMQIGRILAYNLKKIERKKEKKEKEKKTISPRLVFLPLPPIIQLLFLIHFLHFLASFSSLRQNPPIFSSNSRRNLILVQNSDPKISSQECIF
ncbi:unnamed protein product [Citrullus colocynthis]|uniref:Uncharacterized protein n=1 Tax=Citrullus colocynthis TaxID=252529 RepID=A0ABP0YI65_9ROSI